MIVCIVSSRSVIAPTVASFVALRNHARLVSGFLLAILACQPISAAADALNPDGRTDMGIMVGEVTANSALAQVRLTQTNRLVDGDVPGAAGVVKFILESPTATCCSVCVAATAERDYIARAAFTGLAAGTRYTVRTQIGPNRARLRPGSIATFRTNMGAAHPGRVRLAVVTGMNYAKFHGNDRIDRAIHLRDNNTELPAAYAGADKQLGYPALAAILELKPDFFIGTGDNVYYDTPKEPRAKTIPQLRQKWHEQFVQRRYRNLFAEVPTYWMIDDHDYRIDDGDNTGDYLPSPETGRRMMLEQLPVAAANAHDAKTYRTHRINRDLQIWFTENRMYRSPNNMPDGPGKSIWGRQQRAWLKRTLAASDATFKLLISPNPMIGPDDKRKTDNHTNIGGFRHERDMFFAWLRQHGIAGNNFYLVCGDRHWQYHSIHPTGLEEFSCGALIDANSRPGRKPGDPLGTDPDGRIRQVYSQDTPSGGFLLIEVAPGRGDGDAAAATFTFYDERGDVLYAHTKTGRANGV